MNSAEKHRSILIIWNFLVLAYILIAILIKSNWIESAIIAFMVTIGLNLGTYHKYHREIELPKKYLIFIVVSNIFSLFLFLGSSIWLDQIWIIITGSVLVLLVIISFIMIFKNSFPKEEEKVPE
ncbi:MAG: hypothetical protein ACLFQA_10785 [Bacteroidales bacterium]